METKVSQASRPNLKIAIDLAGAPQQVFAATSGFFVERGTSTVLVYVVEDGRAGPAHAAEIVLSPTSLGAFAVLGRDVIDKSPQLKEVKQPGPRRQPPDNWTVAVGPLVSNAVFNARVNDLISTDFYLVPPRQFFLNAEQAKEKGASETTVNAVPLLTCLLDAWEFMRLVAEAETISQRLIAELNAAIMMPHFQG